MEEQEFVPSEVEKATVNLIAVRYSNESERHLIRFPPPWFCFHSRLIATKLYAARSCPLPLSLFPFSFLSFIPPFASHFAVPSTSVALAVIRLALNARETK